MSREIAYYAQGFRMDGARMIPAPLQRFRAPEIAIAAAERMSVSYSGAIAISVEGDDETHAYDEPVELYRAGRVPDLCAA